MSDQLTAGEVLTTTRAVRRRLDFDRPVDPDLLRDCVRIALQAPAASNRVLVRFVIVTDPQLRAAVGKIYAECYAQYRQSSGYIGRALSGDDPSVQTRSARSADLLGEQMGDAPVLVVGDGSIDPHDLAAYLRVLVRLDDLPVEHPDAAAVRATASVFKTVKERRGPSGGPRSSPMTAGQLARRAAGLVSGGCSRRAR